MPEKIFADTERFATETSDGETLLIDAEQGDFILFTGMGLFLWERLAAGATVEGMLGEVATRYGQSAVPPTRAFLESLAEGEMLRKEPAPSAVPVAVPKTYWPQVFSVPTAERYVKMDEEADGSLF
jgi:hypothetical protein